MDKIKGDSALSIWKNILKKVAKREAIDLSSISYDGTNFYTFIDIFNTRCDIAKRGKNKQGRNNRRQVSYALFCSEDSHIPLYYEIYDGIRHDAKQFPLMSMLFMSNKCQFESGFFSSRHTTIRRNEISLTAKKMKECVQQFHLFVQGIS